MRRWPGPARSYRPSTIRSKSVRSSRCRVPESVTRTLAVDRQETDVERVFREVYGQAVATLVRVFGDITLAEDAVQEAFVVASHRWPEDGIPPNPAGWIVTTARNRAIDDLRRSARGRELHEQLGALARSSNAPAFEGWTKDGPVNDDRLRLIF